MTTCQHVYYSGRVQGVGFRYAAQSLAEAYAIAGFVRNLPTGDVELVAEGPADQVEGFLEAVARRMAGYIEHANRQEEAPSGHKGFTVRY
jgi:acylphosphatase